MPRRLPRLPHPNTLLPPPSGPLLPQVVSFEGWERVDAEEIRRGAALGKPRDKLTNVPEMLQLAAAA